MEAAAALYAVVKAQFSDGNMWVSASKLCARKRPRLIPVRDSVIVAGLGLPDVDFGEDLLIMGAALESQEIRAPAFVRAPTRPKCARRRYLPPRPNSECSTPSCGCGGPKPDVAEVRTQPAALMLSPESAGSAESGPQGQRTERMPWTDTPHESRRLGGS